MKALIAVMLYIICAIVVSALVGSFDHLYLWLEENPDVKEAVALGLLLVLIVITIKPRSE